MPAVHPAVVLLLSWVLLPTAAAQAEPLLDLQRAAALAQKRADETTKQRDHLHQETLLALQQVITAQKDTGAGAGPRQTRAVIVFNAAQGREDAAAIGALQSSGALRRAQQDLAEAASDAVAEGEAIEHAAERAEHGEVAPSVSDHIACDGPDCAAIDAREHAALITMGAVGPAFDPAKWPDDKAAPLAALAYAPQNLPLIGLRQKANETAKRAQAATAAAETAHRALAHGLDDVAQLETYANAVAKADAALKAKAAAAQELARTLNRYAGYGRALKHSALLAGDGYALKAGGHKACNAGDCVPAEGAEAAAFIVIGAAEDMNDGLKSLKRFVTPNGSSSGTGGFVFR